MRVALRLAFPLLPFLVTLTASTSESAPAEPHVDVLAVREAIYAVDSQYPVKRNRSARVRG